MRICTVCHHLKIILSFAFLAAAMAGCTHASQNPIGLLGKWLETPVAERGQLQSQSFATTALTKSQADEAATLLWADSAVRLREEYQKPWQDKQIVLGEYVMRFETRLFGEVPEGGRSLYISMHGGGGTPAPVNDAQWKNQIRLYKTPEGSVYVAPRAPTNVDEGRHTVLLQTSEQGERRQLEQWVELNHRLVVWTEIGRHRMIAAAASLSRLRVGRDRCVPQREVLGAGDEDREQLDHPPQQPHVLGE